MVFDSKGTRVIIHGRDPRVVEGDALAGERVELRVERVQEARLGAHKVLHKMRRRIHAF